MSKPKNKSIGSTFDSFLKDERILEETHATAKKRVAELKKKCDCNLSDIPADQLVPAVEQEPDVRTAFMDGTAFLFEFGADGSNHVIAPTVEKLEEYEDHKMDSCGIAVVEVKFIRWEKAPK